MNERTLNVDGKSAKKLVERICDVLSRIGGRKFTAEMARFEDDLANGRICYEAHIIDHGKYVEDDGMNCHLDMENGTDEIGMVFFGGHYHEDEFPNAEELAWISLLEDCIGMCCDKDLRTTHNLARSLADVCGPYIDLNVGSVEELERWLEHGKNDINN